MIALASIAAMACVAGSPSAAGNAVGSRSSLPVPRFVSLKPDRVNVRGGPTRDHEVTFVYTRAGLPVEITFPEEGTPFEIGGISIIKGAQNAAAAQAWVDYVFSPAFQRYHNDVAHRIPVMEGVELAEGTVALEDVTLIEGYDPTAWAAERDALTARWQEEIGSLRG